jgi:hypothetical protein
MFNTSTTTKGASNLFSNIAKNAAQTTNAVANTTTKALNQVSSMAGDVVEAANNAVNKGMNAVANTAKSIPIVNNLLPLGNAAANAAKKNNATTTLANVANAVNKNATAAANALTNAANNAFENVFPNAGQTARPWWVWALAAFVVIVVIVAIVLTVYKDQVKETWSKIKSALGMGPKEEKPPVAPSEPTEAPPAPEAPAEPSLFGQATGLISKILPGKKEVFNVSSNEFTYYDAEPMCKALGAQLATYDQVQEAWKKGADWCNYGWVKGQMAIFPTQKDTYATLQTGPPEDQTACGVPGVNGGFFDNPEMRFGVNCYGVKPEQTANDERILQERGLLPESPATLKIDQQAQEYKERLASIGVLPFNGSAWSA